MELNNFRYALTLSQLLYDIDIQDNDDAINIGLVAYNFIGNKKTTLKKEIISVDCETGIAELPCDLDIIEAVTYYGPEDWNYTSNTKQYGDNQSLYVENYIEGQKAFIDPYYINGKFVKYEKIGNKLKVHKGLSRIQVLYHSILLDEEGLPQLTEKEAIAIAEYIAYTYKYKEAIKTNNSNIFNIAQDLKKQWLFHCDAARVADYISQDQMDKILNAHSSWNRKVFNKSYKPTL